MSGEEATSGSLLFSQIHYHIVPSDGLKDHEIEFLTKVLKENGAQEHPLSNSGSKVALQEVTHVISATSDFPDYDAVNDVYKSVVKPDWVTASVAKGRIANPRSYSPDPRLYFSGLVLCCADIPDGDKDAIMGGVLAMGGLYSSSVTKMVTHIVALTMDHEKCQTVLKKDLKCKIVLPHWFDDCLRLGKRIDEHPYLLPDPEILRKRPQDPLPEIKKLDLQGATSPQPGQLPSPTRTPLSGTRRVEIFQGKIVMLSLDLKINQRLRGVIEDLIRNAGGIISSTVYKADVFICHYRESTDFRLAARTGKEIGNLAWLYYLFAHNSWTSPMKRLLHYPISSEGLPGFRDFRISLSNYNGEARVYLENLVIAAGGTFTKTMKEDNTHLITAHQHSEKCDAAKEWNINMVNHLWLEDSYAKWQIQTLANPRYSHFPPRTNLSEIVGRTSIDKQAVERNFLSKAPEEESEIGDSKYPSATSLQQQNAQASVELAGAQQGLSGSNRLSDRRQLNDKTPKIPRRAAAGGPQGTPATSRIIIDGKENETPSTTNSRGAKDRAAAKLQDQAIDIALYEKEKKRVGGVVFGGRRKNSEDAIANPGQKRSPSRDDVTATDEEGRGVKKIKRSRGLPSMRLLVSGYQGWIRVERKTEGEDKNRLRDMGVLVTEDPSNCTHLASPRIVRTRKFVCALARAPMVISTKYIDDCLAQNTKLNPDDYVLSDPDGEERQSFKLTEALSRARENKGRLLHGMTIYCTETANGGFDTYKAIVEANGGECRLYKARPSSAALLKVEGGDHNPDEIESETPEPVYLLSGSTPEETRLWPKFRKMVEGKGKLPRIVETDWILNTALRQEMHWYEQYALSEARINNASAS